eukprot:1140771-Pelagomonas_calceolata.AAC.7
MACSFARGPDDSPPDCRGGALLCPRHIGSSPCAPHCQGMQRVGRPRVHWCPLRLNDSPVLQSASCNNDCFFGCRG